METDAEPDGRNGEESTGDADQESRTPVAERQDKEREGHPKRRWWQRPIAVAAWGIIAPVIAGLIAGYVQSRHIDTTAQDLQE